MCISAALDVVDHVTSFGQWYFSKHDSAEARLGFVHPSLPILATRGTVLPWEEALMTPVNSLPIYKGGCDFPSPRI